MRAFAARALLPSALAPVPVNHKSPMSKLKIYNTLAREKQEFVPKVQGKVGMYVCGMSGYDFFHVGHARMVMAFDVD